jgi:hypothetical protein
MTDAFFESLDTVLDEEAAVKDRMSTTLAAAQDYIDYGNKVFLLTPSVAKQSLVVGRIVHPDRWADLRAVTETGVMMDELSKPVPSDEELTKAHEQGYRLGLFFGEDYRLGYVASYHISRLYPLTDSEFDGIREADCDPIKAAKLGFFEDMEESIVSAIEARPDSPYRKICERCGSGRVMIAEHYEAVSFSPISLKMNPVKQTIDIRTAHSVKQDIEKIGRRCFQCLKCDWESEPLDPEQYPEVHTCSHDKSALEVLFDVERFVI